MTQNPSYDELLQEVEVLRRQRMAPERERELLEANNRYLERARAAEQALQLPRVLREQEGLFLAAIDQTIITAGECEGVPAVFIEPTDAPKAPGTYTERQGGTVGLKPGSLIFTCSNHVSGEVLLTYVLRMLGKMEVEPRDDSEGFAIEAACHYGFQPYMDGQFIANNVQIIALVKAARIQGHHDATGGSFQSRNLTFIEEVAKDDPTDLHERMGRFLEEALELCQALGAQPAAVYELVRYVFSRPVGEPAQEFGGTYVTLAGLASFAAQDLDACGETELARCNTPEIIAKIRAKRANRPRDGVSLLPGAPEPAAVSAQRQPFIGLPLSDGTMI
jgi:hypothetical protein